MDDGLKTPKFAPLEQVTRPESVYQVLRETILDGRLPPGSRLREARIAADMGISRSPLREALTKLEEDGLVTKVPFRGTFVAEVGAGTIAEIASVRFLVEPYAAELAAPVLLDGQRAAVEATVRAMHTAADRADLPATIDAHLQFHRMFYEHSGHQLLKTMWTGWESKLRLFLAADHRCYDDLHQLAVAHEELLALVFSGEKDLFRRALAHHVHVAPGAAIDEYRTSLPCLVGLALAEEG